MIRIRIWTSDQYYSKGQGIMSLDKDQDQGEDQGLGSVQGSGSEFQIMIRIILRSYDLDLAP